MPSIEASGSMISLFVVMLRFLLHFSLLKVSTRFIASIRFMDGDRAIVGQCLNMIKYV